MIVLLDELFKELVSSLFSGATLKQPRKDYLAEVMHQKKHAHRKAIMTGLCRAATRELQFSDLTNDTNT